MKTLPTFQFLKYLKYLSFEHAEKIKLKICGISEENSSDLSKITITKLITMKYALMSVPRLKILKLDTDEHRVST